MIYLLFYITISLPNFTPFYKNAKIYLYNDIFLIMDKKKFKISIFLLVIGAVLFYFLLSSGNCYGDRISSPIESALCYTGGFIWFALSILGIIILAISLSYPMKIMKIGMSMIFSTILLVSYSIIYGYLTGNVNADIPSISFIYLIYVVGPVIPLGLFILGLIFTIKGVNIYKKNKY